MSVAVGGVDRALVDEAQPVAADGAGAFDGVVGVGEHVGTGAATRALDMIGAVVAHADNAATAQRRAVGVDLQVGGVVAAVERNRAGIVDRSLQLKAGVVVDVHGAGDGNAVEHGQRAASDVDGNVAAGGEAVDRIGRIESDNGASGGNDIDRVVCARNARAPIGAV